MTDWDAWTPTHVAARLAGVEAPWYVAGGWALSLFLGAQLRAHDDLELAVPGACFAEIAPRFDDCDFFVAGDGVLSPYPERADRLHQTWARERATGRWRVDVFREPSDGGTWICRRHADLRLPHDALIERTPGGIPYCRPEVVLLFKAKGRRPKDEEDFAAVLPRLAAKRRRWLADALSLVHPGHPWLNDVR